METKVLKASDVEIGDIVEIIDSLGGSVGDIGDRGCVLAIKEREYNKKDHLLEIKLITGHYKNRIATRFVYRHKIVQREWDK